MLSECTNLTEYMTQFGKHLGNRALAEVTPLHRPGTDPLMEFDSLREPFEAQGHFIQATVKALHRQKTVWMIGEMGCGKTLCGMAACHQHAAGDPYRGVVMCPPHLFNKWAREIKITIPAAKVTRLTRFHGLVGKERWSRPYRPEWYIMTYGAAKDGMAWIPKYYKRRAGLGDSLRCCTCGGKIERFKKNQNQYISITPKELRQQKTSCPKCGEPLWSHCHGQRHEKWPIARYINRHMSGYFDYLVLDEQHSAKANDSAIAHSVGWMVSSVRKVIGMTGTLMGGYAHDVRTLLWRMSPETVVREGLKFTDEVKFSQRYGRIETCIREYSDSGNFSSNTTTAGSNKRVSRKTRPGISPELFGKHLLDKAVFLSLDELAGDLPELDEELMEVQMDTELETEYKRIEKETKDYVRQMVSRGDKRALSQLVIPLLTYPDHPYGMPPIGYWKETKDQSTGELLDRTFVKITQPRDLSIDTIRNKETELLDRIKQERDEGRKCWVFTTMSKTYDVVGRLNHILNENGLASQVLRSGEVPTRVRERWIADHAPSCDAIVSHPGLVSTGLDLFGDSPSGKFNFPTLIFYHTGYSLFTLRQASRRSWRIGQTENCRVVYMYYGETMQSVAMNLMSRKMEAALAIEGQFSPEGLAALAGDEDSMETALAKSLVDNMEGMDASRQWARISMQNGKVVNNGSVPMKAQSQFLEQVLF